MNPLPGNLPVEEGVDRGVQSLVRMLHLMFNGLRLLILVLLVGLAFSGVFYVKEHQEAMLFRFGKLVPKRVRVGDKTELREVLTSGRWYWAFPYPIDVVKRVEAQRSVTVTSTQFWPMQNPNEIEGSGPPPEQTVLRPGFDGYLLTGDANIMHMVWTLTYRVIDARKYYLEFFADDAVPQGTTPAGQDGQPRGVLAVLESILAQSALAEVAIWPVEDVLVLARRESEAGPSGRTNLIAAVRARVETALDGAGLGIEVQQVSLAEVQPPRATRQAFREVVDAAQDYRTQLEEARKYETSVITGAESQASTTLAEAREYRERVVRSVDADRKYFEDFLTEYRKNPQSVLVALYSDTLRDALDKVETKFIVPAVRGGEQEVRLMLSSEPQKPPAAGGDEAATR